MDALASLLTGPRARGAFLMRSMMSAPWSIRIEDEAPLTIVLAVTGAAWITPDEGPRLRLGPGDAVVIRGPEPYEVGDDRGTAPQVIIRPGQECVTLDGQDVSDRMGLGIRSWGNSSRPETILLTGSYESVGEISRPLLDALPRSITLTADQQPGPLVEYLTVEIGREAPGQEAVLDRLLDLLLIAVLRSWFVAQADRAPGWYRASTDREIGAVLAMIHDHPADPWTVTSLAAAAGISRATLARRFGSLVGQSPMSYLAGWRLALAADLLHDPDRTLDSIARQVGYGSAFALSTAFKRRHGVSPSAFRARAA